MSLGNSLFHARKQAGLSQEAAAEKLGVSRQTISKWLSLLYRLSLDELLDFAPRCEGAGADRLKHQ